MLDNTGVSAESRAGRYIAHIAVGCRNVDEAARWYAEVLGLQPVRVLDDRVTFSFGGVLQLVCHLEKRVVAKDPRAYPQHYGLTFLRMEDFSRLQAQIEKLDIKLMMPSVNRFPGTPHEHRTLMLADPSGNVVEFKCYLRPEYSY